MPKFELKLVPKFNSSRRRRAGVELSKGASKTVEVTSEEALAELLEDAQINVTPKDKKAEKMVQQFEKAAQEAAEAEAEGEDEQEPAVVEVSDGDDAQDAEGDDGESQPVNVSKMKRDDLVALAEELKLEVGDKNVKDLRKAIQEAQSEA